ncbi:proton-dependent oligopeptide transporter, POT family [Chitinophaga sp. CF118]|uniref:peptide MFS transporter n=1 Tax=Chitinophaga sp. CF118 TaxID=1884367 RepID=UPI0008EB4B1F|nr:peptide MFS transporter [Chitinophaga sp. CF118]SFD25039.1 proton-dependent oligopeptide transporter, POT family [Chitinophaga sp. CF118]
MIQTAVEQPVTAPNIPKKGQHHPGLYVLFFTEMWERFGYYLMIGIFFLYLIDPTANGGKGFDTAHASDLVGSYIALVYLSPFIGGMMADRYLGYRRAVILGGTLLAAGYFGLAFPGDTAMYISLGLIIVGNGFFKPNIGTILGNLYNREDLRPKKDVAYSIFYMGVNIGAFICNFVAAYLRNHYGWGHAFAAAGVGMVVGLIIFSSKLKVIADGDIRKPAQKEDMPMSRILSLVFLPAAIAATIGYFMTSMTGHSIFGTRSIDAFMFACVPIIIFYIRIYTTAAKEDKRGLGALLAFFVVAIIFWVIYNQNSTGLTIWADQYTDRSMSPAVENAAKPLGMLQTVTLEPHAVTKIDDHFRAITDASGNTITVQGPDPYFQNLPKEQWPATGKMKLISTEIFQSINPFFIVAFSLLVIGLFGWMAKRGKEPTTPVKIAMGIFLAGFSSLLMVMAAAMTSVYVDKSSMAWLFGTYAVFTVGEILVSPIGLSMVSKLSPPRVTALMMGGWYLVNAIAGKVAGMMATFWDSFIDKKSYFLILVICAGIAGTVMLIISKWIAKVVREKTGSY